MERSTVEAPPIARHEAVRVHVDVRDLHLTRESRPVFRGLSCSCPRGQISVVLGGSGSGKTTLLRMIACLDQPDRGQIWMDGDIEITGLPERQKNRIRRNVGMLFQHGALLDAMSVYNNVALPLREHTKRSETEIREEVHRIFESVGLEDVDHLLPAQLSGGMLKRAALARALITEPQILLCDEPFSGLDPATIRLAEALLVDLNKRLGVTTIVTSHHITSTLRMSHQVVVLSDGRAAAVGPPEEIRQSTDPLVAAFFEEGHRRHRTSAGRRDANPTLRSPTASENAP